MQRLWRRKTQALALPNGVVGQALMRAYLPPTDIEHWPLTGCVCPGAFSVALHETAIVARRHKTNLLAFRLGSHRQTPLSSHCSHLWLGEGAQREAGMPKLLLIQDMQHIRLILGGVNTLAQTSLSGQNIGLNAHVMASRQIVCAESQGTLQQEGEANMSVTVQTRVRGAPLNILVIEVIND